MHNTMEKIFFFHFSSIIKMSCLLELHVNDNHFICHLFQLFFSWLPFYVLLFHCKNQLFLHFHPRYDTGGSNHCLNHQQQTLKYFFKFYILGRPGFAHYDKLWVDAFWQKGNTVIPSAFCYLVETNCYLLFSDVKIERN